MKASELDIFKALDKVVPLEILVVLIVIGVIIFIWDLLMRQSVQIQEQGGLGKKAEIVALRGNPLSPVKPLVSQQAGLSSQPHGVIRENGVLIPVDVIPSSKKVRDRHVVQMLVHLRLIEEQERKRPDYGLLILGPEQRAVRIKNSEEKQRWLDTLIDEMRSIIDGVPAVPKPHYFKCRNCDVKDLCQHSLAKTEGSRPDTSESDDDGA
jgi:CRISPR/Cas system-associated exonuclease Cas4 (RecB family)